MKRLFRLLILTALSCSAATTASAQYMSTSPLSPAVFNRVTTPYLINQSQILNTQSGGQGFQNILRRGSSGSANVRGSSQRTNKTAGGASGAASGIKRAGTTFRPVATSIAPALMAANADTPELRKKMQEFFAGGLSNYEDLLRKQGLPTKDVARATSFFIASAYQVASGNKLERGQVEALRDDVRNALLDNEAFQKMSNREKQETYETMAVMGDFMMTGYTIGKQQNNEKIQQAFKDVAKDQLERFLGASVNNIKITNQGIEF